MASGMTATRISVAIFAFLALFIVASGFWFGVIGWVPLPYQDQWDHATAQALTGNLFKPHNEHRIILARLTFWLDIWLGRDLGVIPLAFVYLFNLAHAVLLVGLARWTWPEAGRFRLVVAAAVIFSFFFSGFQFENFISGFQNQFTGVFFFASAAIAALAFAAKKPPRLRIALVALSMACASLSVASMSSGLLVTLLLPLAALCLGLPVAAGAYVLFAAVCWALYFTGYPVTGDGLLSQILDRPVGVGLDFLAYLGGAVPNSISAMLAPFPYKLALARTFGLVGLLASLGVIALLVRRRQRARPPVVAWATILVFLLGVGLLTSLGRSAFGAMSMLSNRYGAGAAVLWAVLAVWAIMPAWSRRSRVALALSFVVLLVLAAAQAFWLGGVQAIKYFKRDAEAALLMHVDAPELYKWVYPDPARPPAISGILRQHHQALFSAPWSRLDGQSLAVRTDAVCPSAPTDTKVDAHGAASRVSLTVRAPGSAQALAALDADGKVAGLLIRGMTGDLASSTLGWRHHPAIWSGFVKAKAGAGEATKLDVWAIDASGRGVCRMNPALQIGAPR
jgi:hypothetical protein